MPTSSPKSPQPSLALRGRHGFRWSSHFSVRQLIKYRPEDRHLLDIAANTTALIEALLADHEMLKPPCYNCVALRNFLRQADLHNISTGRPKLALIDDRREVATGENSTRNWESQSYIRYPPPGDSIQRLALDEGELFKKLQENVV